MTRPKILIVDDHADIRTALTVSLAAHEFDVIEASTGEEAVSAFFSHAPQVAIIDYGLADMTGIEVGRKILQSSQGTKPGLILFSGGELGAPSDREGFDCFLSKPIAIPELIQQIEALLPTGRSID